MTARAWLWPDRTIGKRESRRLREEHNALVNRCAALDAALRDLLECILPDDINAEGSGMTYRLEGAVQACMDDARAALDGAA